MAELMKGNVWHERKDAKDRKGNPIVTYPVIVEPKVDEIRVHVIREVGERDSLQFLSYAGKPLHNLERYAAALCTVMRAHAVFELDCGVEVNGNFNDSYRWVRSSTGIPANLQDAAVRWHLYDFPARGFAEDYEARKAELEDMARRLRLLGVVAGTLPAELACSPEQVTALYLHYRELGYEGAMVKRTHFTYARGKRTDDWLKYKPENDADGIIEGFEEAICGKDQPELGLRVGDPLGRIGSVHVRMEDGSTASPHGIPHGLGKEMKEHPEKFLGQWCEFNYMERDRQGGYRHPTWYRLREAKA